MDLHQVLEGLDRARHISRLRSMAERGRMLEAAGIAGSEGDCSAVLDSQGDALLESFGMSVQPITANPCDVVAALIARGKAAALELVYLDARWPDALTDALARIGQPNA